MKYFSALLIGLALLTTNLAVAKTAKKSTTECNCKECGCADGKCKNGKCKMKHAPKTPVEESNPETGNSGGDKEMKKDEQPKIPEEDSNS